MAENIVSADNVGIGKPNLKVSGGILRAPRGTARPTDASTPYDPAYLSMGYVGEDGVTLSAERDNDPLKVWGQVVVRRAQTSYEVSLTFTLVESRRADTLKAIAGEDNVSVEGNTIVVRGNEKELPIGQWGIDMLDQGLARRIDVGSGQITEIGDITYADGELIGYEVTLSCYPDENGDAYKELIEVGQLGGDGNDGGSGE